MVTQNLNFIPNEPNLRDLLNTFKKEIKLEFNCHHLGTVAAFNPDNQTAQATINYVKTFLQNSDVGDAGLTTVAYPIVMDAPVVCLGGGTGSLTFPITVGDECLILFNDRDLDNWFSGSSSSAPNTPRLHAFTDAIIIVGVRSLPNVLSSYSTESVKLAFGDNSIEFFTDKTVITTSTDMVLTLNSSGTMSIDNLDGEFVQAIIKLFTDIQNATVNTMFGPQPLIMPTYTVDLAVLQTFES